MAPGTQRVPNLGPVQAQLGAEGTMQWPSDQEALQASLV